MILFKILILDITKYFIDNWRGCVNDIDEQLIYIKTIDDELLDQTKSRCYNKEVIKDGVKTIKQMTPRPIIPLGKELSIILV